MLTVYAGDDPMQFETAVESVLTQTLPPAELLIVADGPLTDELRSVVARAKETHPDVVEHHELAENRGRGAAAREGIEQVSHDLVGIMSADDICVSDRFERQVAYLVAHPNVDVVGGHVAEFADDPADPEAIRHVAIEPDDIARLARFRSPMNEVTVLLRRETVIDAGNYRSTDRMEDYDLWVRLLQNRATLANIDAVLVKVRAGEDLFARRGGLEYVCEEFRQQVSMYRLGFIGVPRVIGNLAVRVPVRLLPNGVRSVIYRWLLRDDPAN